MRVVWANDQVTSKKVISVLQEKMDWTQSTIKTILCRLVGKGVLNTEHEGRKFIYTANIEETEAVRDYAEDIFNRICNKKVGNVIGSIIENHVLSFDDIDRLEKNIRDEKIFRSRRSGLQLSRRKMRMSFTSSLSIRRNLK